MKTTTFTITKSEAEDLVRSVLFTNVAIRQDANHNPAELDRIQALYERLVDLNIELEEEPDTSYTAGRN